MNQPINMSNTQEPDKNIPVRQLPKKRKFFPSELEEIDKSTNQTNKSPVQQISPFTQSDNQPNRLQQQSVVIVPPQSVAVDYSFRESEPLQSHLINKYTVDVNRYVPHDDGRITDPNPNKSVKINSLPLAEPISNKRNSAYLSENSGVCIDLNEWINHRVLAKQNNLYLPGIIKQANVHGEVWVDLDYCEVKLVKYSNLFTNGKFDILSDASPSKGQLTVGTRVCVRKEMKDMLSNVFIEGIIIDIINNPMCFIVRCVNDELTVKRADLRLLQPPWWDELTDLDVDHGSVNVVIRGSQSYQHDGSYNNMMHGMMMPEQNGMPLQLNQVIPTIQGGNDYYRSTGTSPLHLPTPVSHNSTCTPLSNGSVDELRQPQYEDFCESDDDLRREDILFPSDAGMIPFYLFRF